MFRVYPQTHWSYRAVATLAGGYIGSTTIGFLCMVSRPVQSA